MRLKSTSVKYKACQPATIAAPGGLINKFRCLHAARPTDAVSRSVACCVVPYGAAAAAAHDDDDGDDGGGDGGGDMVGIAAFNCSGYQRSITLGFSYIMQPTVKRASGVWILR